MSEDSNRFLGLPVWKWDGVAGFVSLVGLIAVIAGGALGIIELKARAESAQAKATLELLDVWETRGYLEDYRALDGRIQAVLSTVPAADIEYARGDLNAEKTLYRKVAAQVLSDPKAQAEFENLIYFFQRLHLCVAADLCSHDATKAFFDSTMTSFARAFAAEIASRQDVQPDYAEGLVRGL